jgi:hypothetical protein
MKGTISPAKNFWLAALSDLVRLGRIGLDHLDGFEVRIGQGLRRLGVGLEPGRRAAHRVHHHRVVERGREDLAGRRVGAHGGEVGLVGHRGVVLAGHEGLRSGLRLERDQLDILHRHAVLVEHPGQAEVRRGARRADADGLALQVGEALDVVAHGQAVGTIGLVHLEDLHDRHAVGVPGHMGLDRRRRALDRARGQGQVAVLLRNHFDFDLQPVLLEDAGLVGQGERREAGPAGHAEGDLGFLRVGARRHASDTHARRQQRGDFSDRLDHQGSPVAFQKIFDRPAAP